MSPEEIVSFARYCGLDAISITDHDTFAGARKALKLKEGIHIIPGVEISVAYDPGTLHILGYFPAFPDEFEKILERLQLARTIRFPKILEKLNKLGLALSPADVLTISGDGQIGRPHIAKALIEKGHVKDFEEAFIKYLGKGKPAYVEKDRLTSTEAIDAIIGFGGIPVLAHPFTLNLPKQDLRDYIENLVKQGLKGIEIFYPDHTRALRKFYLDIAKDLKLLATGGTDFHSGGHNEISLGDYGLDKKRYSLFLETLEKCIRG